MEENEKNRKEKVKKLVYVLNKVGTPLMPCTPVIARLILKEDKARVVRRTPFTIKLKYRPATEYVQPLTLGEDAGSVTVGVGVTDDEGKVYYASEVKVRNDITGKMDRRRKYRRSRRTRKCRYRKCRFLNRKNSIRKERFAPSVISKIEAHTREIDFVKSLLPIKEVIIEAGMFDPHALKNPDVLTDPLLYQRGLKYGFHNTKAYVLHRDNYTCQYCKGKSKDRRLHCHHIIFKEHGGSDHAENLIVLCEMCHTLLHDGHITLKAKGKKKGTLKHATQMNVIRNQVLKRTKAIETFGYITKTHREALGLEKTHAIDALVIASKGKPLTFKNNTVLLKKCISKGDYRQTKGVRSHQRIPTGKIRGFCKFDKVRYEGNEYFIKGRMTTGYAILMDIKGSTQELRPIPRFSKMMRISARTSQIVMECSIHLAPEVASFLEQI